MSGFITLHRSMVNWEWYTEVNTKTVFLHCLLKANWRDKSYRGKLVKRGHFLTSVEILAQETGLSVRNVRTAIKNLKATSELTLFTSSQGTEIKVNNYDKYQDVTDKVTSETPNERQAPDKQVTTTNNNNHINKDTIKPKKSASKKSFDRDLTLSDQWKELALNYWAGKNRNDLDVNDQFFQFKTHHMANATKSADWQASWSTWYSNAVKFNKAPKATFQVITNNTPPPRKTMPKAGIEE